MMKIKFYESYDEDNDESLDFESTVHKFMNLLKEESEDISYELTDEFSSSADYHIWYNNGTYAAEEADISFNYDGSNINIIVDTEGSYLRYVIYNVATELELEDYIHIN